MIGAKGEIALGDDVAEAAARAGLHGKGIVAGHGCGIERNVAIAKFDERIALLGKDEADVRLGGEHTLGEDRDRKSVVTGKSVSGRVDLGGRRIIKKKKNRDNT